MTEDTHRFVETRRFREEAENIGFGELEKARIKAKLRSNPVKGTEIPNDIYKVRVPFRGGARIIHTVTVSVMTGVLVTYLLSIYLKSDKEDLSASDYKEIRRRIALAKERMKGKGDGTR